ncbi:hypothetical protein [Xanthobacter pseudotagetidis]|uniref:hypothetical protein n=1 Tax=Xanthobacter pseudotagetidis TaxID=3119911 RepID=UPI003729EDF7
MGRSGPTREEADRLARLVADVLHAAAEARRTLARLGAPAGAADTGPDPHGGMRAAFSRLVEETALAALLLRAVREGDLGAPAARREMDRLSPCPAGAALWPAAFQADAARLSGLRRALAAQDAIAGASAGAASQHAPSQHALSQRKEPRRRPSGRPRLRLVGSEDA